MTGSSPPPYLASNAAGACYLTGQSWGVVLLWMMGMLDLSDIVKERLRSELMTLMSMTRSYWHSYNLSCNALANTRQLNDTELEI